MTDELVLRMLQRINENIESIREALPREATSSVQINTSARGYDITVKCYVGSDVHPAGDQAINEYLGIRAEIERRLMGEKAA